MADKEHIFNSDLTVKQKALSLLICSAQEYQSRIAKALKAYNLSLTQLSILHVIDTVPHDQVTVGMIKEIMVEDSPNVSRALRKLQEKELVTKTRDEVDQRIVYIGITDKGRELHILCDKELQGIDIGLNDDESVKLTELLLKI